MDRIPDHQPARPIKNKWLLLILLFGSFHATNVQAAISGSPVVWGGHADLGLTNVPVAAQSGVMAVAAADIYLAALLTNGSVVVWGRFDTPTNVPAFAQSGVTAIAAGEWHMLALKDDGTVAAWGNDTFGAVSGIGGGYAMVSPVTLDGQVLTNITAVAAGRNHSAALKSDGGVVAWGGNMNEQVTVPLTAQSEVVALAAGALHNVALKTDGRVVVWGYSDTTNVPASALSGVVAIAAGGYHTLALKNNGSVIAWGFNNYGQTNVPTAAQSGVIAIAAGTYHNLALKSDGSVVVWGDQNYGHTNVPPIAQGGLLSIAAGGHYSLGIVNPVAPAFATQPSGLTVDAGQKASFSVVATGYPLNYQWRKDGTNLGGATARTYALDNAWFSDAGSYSVVVSNHLGAVTSTAPAMLAVNPLRAGSVVTWPSQTSVPLAAQGGIVAIAAGFFHTVALTTNGGVVTWGEDIYFNFGPSFNDRTNVPVAAQSGVTAISAGFGHTVALKGGRVIAWGRNESGESSVPPAAEQGVIAISAGGDFDDNTEAHTLALTTNGSVQAWGGNSYGQTTVPPSAQSGVVAIAAGGYHSVALKQDGTVVTWGHGHTNIPLVAQSGVTAIAACGYYTIVLKTDGSIVLLEHADGFLNTVLTNVPPAAQSGIVAIAPGPYHSAVLKNNGSVVNWGHYYWFTTPPTPVVAQSGVTALGAGYRHLAALVDGPVPLQARRSGPELVLTWPVNGFTLQATTNWASPVIWSAVTNPPALRGAQWAVTNTFSGRAKFYRLRKP